MTFSLSKPSAAFLRDLSAEKNAHLSALVETMIENSRRARELIRLNAAVTAYYDSMPESVQREESAWGEIGAAGLAALAAEIEPESEEIPQEISHTA
jgi:hypothetical protein